MKDTKDITIDGYKYTCTQFDVRKSLSVLTRVAKVIGEPLGSILARLEPGKKATEQDIGKLMIGEALGQLTRSLGEDEAYELFKDICRNVVVTVPAGQVGGQLKDDTFDLHFRGKGGLIRLFKVVKFALEVNYENFLQDLVGLFLAQSASK